MKSTSPNGPKAGGTFTSGTTSAMCCTTLTMRNGRIGITLVKDEIIAKQQGAGGEYRGSWSPNKPKGAPYEYAEQAGRLYITAMCLLILEMPYRHQPIYGD